MIKSNRKSQLSGQVFIYILALVIIGGIIAYGYYAIASLKNRADQLAFIEFKNSIESTIKTSSTYGNVKIQEFLLPGSVNEVCFINLDFKPDSPLLSICNPSSLEYRPIICNSWLSNSPSNVFLMPTQYSILASKISVDGNRNWEEDNIDRQYSACNDNCNFICFKSFAGRIKIRLDGKGTRTFIREP